MPKVTVIVPAYNAEKHIDECIDSILNQSYHDLELIIVNDGSTDNTMMLINQWAKKDPRIVSVNKENGGVSSARNTGLERASGEWIAFVDSDDYLQRNYLENILAIATTDDDVIITNGAWKSDTPYDGNLSVLSEEDKEQLKLACLAFDEYVFPYNIDAPWGKLFRRAVIEKNHIAFPKNLSRSEDALFCVTYYELCGNVKHYEWAGYVHTENEGSLCRTYKPNTARILAEIIGEEQKWIERFHPNNAEYQQAVCKRALPGIDESEQVWVFHRDFAGTLLDKIRAEKQLLKTEQIHGALRQINMNYVHNKAYRIRLMIYRLHLGWMLVLLKSR